jgi:hypothetical protein
MVLHDMICNFCGHRETDVICQGRYRKECACGGLMEIDWSRRPQNYIGIHPRERSVVWYNSKDGTHATPMRNDIPMPARYKSQGYERREFDSLRSLDSFCKQNKIVNEKAHYDSNGRGYDDE